MYWFLLRVVVITKKGRKRETAESSSATRPKGSHNELRIRELITCRNTDETVAYSTTVVHTLD